MERAPHPEGAAPGAAWIPSGCCTCTVVSQGASVFELLVSKDQALLVRRDVLLVLDICLAILDRVAALNFEGDRRGDRHASKRLHENLHDVAMVE